MNHGISVIPLHPDTSLVNDMAVICLLVQCKNVSIITDGSDQEQKREEEKAATGQKVQN